MTKRIILFICGILLLTGCSVEYELVIDGDNNINESFKVDANVSETYTKAGLFAEYSDEYPIYIDQNYIYYAPDTKSDEYTYYDKSYVEKEDGYIFSYKASYDLENYKRARIGNEFYKTFSTGYISAKEYYYISGTTPVLYKNYKELDNVNVRITLIDCTVVENNADEVLDNTYIWHITRDNKKNILLNYKLNKELNNKKDDQDPNDVDNKAKDETNKLPSWATDNVPLITIACFGALIIVIIGVVIVKKKRL